MMIATMKTASATSAGPVSICMAFPLRAGAAVGQDQNRPAGLGDVHGLGLRRIGCGQLRVPGRAAVAHPSRATGTPALHPDHLPDIVARFKSLNIDFKENTPQEFRSFVAAETEKWGKVVRDAGIKLGA